MSQNLRTAKLVDEVVRFGAYAGVAAATILAPNIIQVLDKCLRKLDKTLNAREREREALRIVAYMKQRGLLAGDYEHGLKITEKARKRFEKIELDELRIKSQPTWDGMWRIVIYDIPEKKKYARDALGSLLRQIGCFQLQKSTWITPFPCASELETICVRHDVDQYVSYFEAKQLSNAKVLIGRFRKKYPSTHF